MKPLIQAEFQGFLNLFRVASGRRVLAIQFVALVYFSFLAALSGREFFDLEGMEQLLEGPQGAEASRLLIGIAMVLTSVVVFLSGLKTGDKLLFSGPEVDFLLVSPAPRFSILFRAWARLIGLNLFWSCAISWPFITFALAPQGSPVMAHVLVPLANLLLVMPILALLLALQVFVMRWFAGPRVKLILGIFFGLAGFGVVGVFFAGLAGSEGVMEWLLTGVVTFVEENGRLPMLWGGPAELIATGAGHSLGTREILGLLVLLVAGPMLLLFAGTLYPRAVENERIAMKPLLARKRTKGSRGRPWPAQVDKSMWKKDLAMVLKQPAKLLGLLVLTVAVVFFAGNFGITRMIDPKPVTAGGVITVSRAAAIPPDVRHTMALLFVMALTSVMVLPGLVIQMTASEKGHWPLLAGSPAPTKHVFNGKTLFPYANLLYFALITMGSGAFMLRVVPSGLFGFLLLATPMAYGLLGLGCAFGTIPVLARPIGGETGQAVRSIMAAVLIMGAVVLACLPGIEIWSELKSYFDKGHGEFRGVADEWMRPLLAGGAMAYFFVIGFIGFRVARFNFKHLLGAAPE